MRLLNILVVTAFLAGCSSTTTITSKKVAKIDPLAHDAPIKDLKKAAKINVEMGEKYLAMGQIARAKKKITYALELQPNLPEAHNAFGYFLQTVKENKEAEKYYKQAIKLSPNSEKAKYYSNYGSFLCSIKRYNEAEEAFLVAIQDKKYQYTAEVYENAGLCALQQGDKTKAEKYLDLALRHEPTRPKSVLELAELYYGRDNIAAASAYLKQYKNIAVATPRSLLLGMKLAQAKGDEDEAASIALMLKNMFKTSKEYNEFLQNG